jgi:HK97 family phage portal protein
MNLFSKALGKIGSKMMKAAVKMEGKSHHETYESWEGTIGKRYFRSQSEYMESMAAISWVYSCVRVIYQTASKVPLMVYKKDDVIEKGDLVDLIEKPNPFFTMSDLIASYAIDMSLVGEFFLVKDRTNGFNQPTELWRVDPRYMKPVKDEKEFIKGFIYENKGVEIPFDREEVIWIKWPNPLDPYRGLGPIEALTHSLDLEVARQNYDKVFFDNYGMVGGYLQTDEVLSDDHFERLKEEAKENFEGVKNAGRIPVFDAGLEYKKIGLSRKEMNLLEDAKFNRDMIIGAMGVQPVKVGIFEYANYANSKEQDEMFKRETIAPLMKKLVDALNNSLTPLFGQDLWIGHEDLVPEDADKVADRLLKMQQTGAFTINELREMAGKKPVTDGDIILVSSSLVPLEKVGMEEPDQNDDNPDNNNPNDDDNVNENDDEDEKSLVIFDSKSFEIKKMPKNIMTIYRRKDRYLNKIEKQWKPEIQKFFDQQADRVIRAIYGRGKKSGYFQFDIDDIFDQLLEDEELQKILTPLHIQVMKQAWKDGNELLDRVVPFNPQGDSLLEQFIFEVAALVKRINGTTRKEIQKQLQIAMERGYSIPQLANGFDRENFKGIAGVFREASESRARTIARTETANVYNQAAIMRYERGGIQKVYVMDGRDYDEECRTANGQIWTLEYAMQNPTEHPNCTRAFAPAVGIGGE